MRIFNIFKKEKRSEEVSNIEDLLLQSGAMDEDITKEMALNIPSVSACIELISNTIATLPIKLYEEKAGKVSEVLGDERIKLLNDDTRDTLDSFQFKKALIEDYFLSGGGYAYINKKRNKIVSLHYVDEKSLSITMNSDPIFKDYSILVNGANYKSYDFIKMLRSTKNGATGSGIIERNKKILLTAYNSLEYENVLAKTGGNKKGFIKAAAKLTKEIIDDLKLQWRKMYSKNSENCVVLNNGLEFKESSATSTEMQLNENKVTNGNEICKIFNVPPAMIVLGSKVNEDDYNKFVKMAILPLLQAIITALNRDFLLEKEKESFYYAFDTKELLKGDIEKRYKAYEIAIKNGFLGINEVRYEEDKEPIEAFNDVIKLGLQDVLYNVKTGEVYTPNTDKSTNIKAVGGGEKNNKDRD